MQAKALRGGGDSHAEDDFAEKMILTPGTFFLMAQVNQLHLQCIWFQMFQTVSDVPRAPRNKQPVKLTGAPDELRTLSGLYFVPDAIVNDRASYVARDCSKRRLACSQAAKAMLKLRIAAPRFVLWYSTTNQTCLGKDRT